jgi:hypothetical protein
MGLYEEKNSKEVQREDDVDFYGSAIIGGGLWGAFCFGRSAIGLQQSSLGKTSK